MNQRHAALLLLGGLGVAVAGPSCTVPAEPAGEGDESVGSVSESVTLPPPGDPRYEPTCQAGDTAVVHNATFPGHLAGACPVPDAFTFDDAVATCGGTHVKYFGYACGSFPEGTYAWTSYIGCCQSACAGCPTGLCGTSLTAFTGTRTPNWNFNGGAAYDPTTQTAVMVSGTVNFDKGTVIYNDPIAVDDMDVTFEYKMTPFFGRADGMGFFLQTDSPTVVGGTGGGLGMAGLHGYGVELDIFNNGECGDVDSNHAGIDLLDACNFGPPTPIRTSPLIPFDLADGLFHAVELHFVNGVLSVAIDDNPIPNLQAVPLTGFVPGTQYFLGFSGGTGGETAREEVRNVHITFPTTHCL